MGCSMSGTCFASGVSGLVSAMAKIVSELAAKNNINAMIKNLFISAPPLPLRIFIFLKTKTNSAIYLTMTGCER